MTKHRPYYREGEQHLIENYELAKADNFVGWHLHHRDEIRILPSGMVVLRTRRELIENGRYNFCPANELIYLTISEHAKLHAKYMPETRKAALEQVHASRKGSTHSEETKLKMSLSHKGKKYRPRTAEHNAKISRSCKGRVISEETRQKMSAAHKARQKELI